MDVNVKNNRTIGLLVSRLEEAYQTPIWQAVWETVRQHGVNLLCFEGGIWRADSDLERTRNVAYDLAGPSNLDGLIVVTSSVGTASNVPDMVEFCRRYAPLPMISIGMALPGIPSVVVDNAWGIRQVMDHLIEQHGRRRIAFIRGPEGHPEAESRYAAYRDALTAHGLAFDPDLVAPGDFESAGPAIRLLLDERKVTLDALVTANDSMAYHAMQLLRERGIAVPEQVALVGFDDTAAVEFLSPPLTTVRQPIAELGRQAARLLLTMLDGGTVPEQTQLPTRMVVRQSCGCVAAAEPADELIDLPLPATPVERRRELADRLRQSMLHDIERISPDQILQMSEAFLDDWDTAQAATWSVAPFEHFLSWLARLEAQQMDEREGMAWQHVLSSLRRVALAWAGSDVAIMRRVEDGLHRAQAILAEMSGRAAAWRHVQQRRHEVALYQASQALMASLDQSALWDALVEHLPAIGIDSFYLALYDPPGDPNTQFPTLWSKLMLAGVKGKRPPLELQEQPFLSRLLLPSSRWLPPPPFALVIEPLHVRNEQLGFVLLQAGPLEGAIYEILRSQISGALKNTFLLEQYHLAGEALSQAYSRVESLVAQRTAQLQVEIKEREQAEARAQRRREWLTRVLNLSKQITQITDRQECLARIYQAVREGLRFDRVALFVYDAENKIFYGTSGTDRRGQMQDESDFHGTNETFEMLLHKPDGVIFTQDYEATFHATELWGADHIMAGVRQHVMTAAWVGDRPVAVLCTDNLISGRIIEEEQVEALRLFSGYAGLAIRNVELLEQVRQTEQQFRSIFENATEGIFQISLRGEMLNANPAMLRLLVATSLDDLKNKYRAPIWLNFVRPDDEAHVRRLLAEQGHVSGFEFQSRRSDGQAIWLLLNAHIVYNGNRRPLYLEGTIQDITEHRQAEQTIQERMLRLELVSQIGQRTIALLDVNDLIRQAVNLIGYTFNYYVVVILLVQGDDLVLQAATLPAMWLLEGQTRLRIGEQGITGWVAAHGEPLLVNDVSQDSHYLGLDEGIETRAELAVPLKFKGQVIGVLDAQSAQLGAFSQLDLFTLQTIADQLAITIENARLYEQAHRRAERLALVNRIGRTVGAVLNLDDLMQAVYRDLHPIFKPDAFFIALYDAEQNMLDFRFQIDQGVLSPPECQLLGQSLTSWVVQNGRPLLVRHLSEERDRLPVSDLWGSMKQADSWLGVPMRISKRQEAESNAVIGVICVQAYRPNVYGEEDQLLLSTIADQVAAAVESARLYEAVQQELAQRKKLEEQLVQAQKMEAVGRLAGGVAHDFNNLLTAIIGYTDMLLGDAAGWAGSDSARADLNEIKKAAHRAADLTRQLLAFGRKQILRPKLLSLNSIIADMENMLRRLIGEDIELVIRPAPVLGMIEADPGQIQQVIMNLAVNARDAMPQGGRLTMETANAELDADYQINHLDVEPGPFVMLAVSDTGIGMDKFVQQRLFEPFFTTKEFGRGTGLGLATVHGIVKQSRGHIFVYSEVGRGSTFKIYLPRVAVEAPSQMNGEPVVALPRGAETILIVEDEDLVRDLAQRVLQRSGYKVLIAADAVQAIRLCDEYAASIDLLITDVVMPGGLSGRDLAEHLKQTRPTTRVLFMSGYTDSTIVHHGMLEEGVMFMQKPFTPLALARQVREMLEK